MRKFFDPAGRPWDVMVGRESWGVLYALFIPAGPERGEPIRQTVLSAESHGEAERELSSLDDEGLAALFRRSTVKER